MKGAATTPTCLKQHLGRDLARYCVVKGGLSQGVAGVSSQTGTITPVLYSQSHVTWAGDGKNAACLPGQHASQRSSTVLTTTANAALTLLNSPPACSPPACSVSVCCAPSRPCCHPCCQFCCHPCTHRVFTTGMFTLAQVSRLAMCSVAKALHPVLPLSGASYEDVAVSLVNALQSGTDLPATRTWSQPGQAVLVASWVVVLYGQQQCIVECI